MWRVEGGVLLHVSAADSGDSSASCSGHFALGYEPLVFIGWPTVLCKALWRIENLHLENEPQIPHCLAQSPAILLPPTPIPEHNLH
jgi:hypothetical protein